MISLVSCTKPDQAKEYIKKGKYDKAISYLSDHKKDYSKKEYKNLLNQCNYHLAKESAEIGNYDYAAEYLENNNYSNAQKLKKKYETLSNRAELCDKIMEYYNKYQKNMKSNLDSEKKGKIVLDATSASDYYMAVGYHLSNIKESLNKNQYPDYEDVSVVFGENISSIQNMKKWVNVLSKYFVWSKKAFTLQNISAFLNSKDESFTRNKRTKTKARSEIFNVDGLEDYMHVSSYVIAIALCVLKDYGAKISLEQFDTIIRIDWDRETFGYYVNGADEVFSENTNFKKDKKRYRVCKSFSIKKFFYKNNKPYMKVQLTYGNKPMKEIFSYIQAESNKIDEPIMTFSIIHKKIKPGETRYYDYLISEDEFRLMKKLSNYYNMDKMMMHCYSFAIYEYNKTLDFNHNSN